MNKNYDYKHKNAKCLLCKPHRLMGYSSIGSHLQKKHNKKAEVGRTHVFVEKTNKQEKNAKCKICKDVFSKPFIHVHLSRKHNKGAKLGVTYTLTNKPTTAESTGKRTYNRKSIQPTIQLSTQQITIPAMITFSFMTGPIQIKPLVE